MKEILKNWFEVLRDLLVKILSYRIFTLAIAFSVMFAILLLKLFHLQIREGEDYLNEYTQMTEKTVSIPGTRGNIYDRSGNLLAYNELAYTITIQNTGAYSTNAAMNMMILRLVQILDKHDVSIQGRLEIGIDEEGAIVYTSTSEDARKGFLRDFYGLQSARQLTDSGGKYPADASAQELFDARVSLYDLNKLKDERGNQIILSNWELLQIINIRYTMSLTSFRRYAATPITGYVDEETVADIMENSGELQGINVAESTIRIYNDSIYFAPIIGYMGKVSSKEELEELQKINEDYELTDIVGKTGIEHKMEGELLGKKGYRDLIVNNTGSIMQIKGETEPATGNDIYLTIDRELQIGIYYLIEQQLAGILADKLVNKDVEITDVTDSSKMTIPIKAAYYQLINNNVLSLSRMASEEASEIEKEINNRYTASEKQIIESLRYELMSDHAVVMKELPRDKMSYMSYIYSYLLDAKIIRRDSMDINSEKYIAWKNDEISLRDYIYSGIADNWIDTTKLEIENRYSDADDIYEVLVNYVLEHLQDDTKFTKRIYRYLVNDGVITGRQLCLALYEQEVLTWDEQQIQLLKVNGEDYAFAFMREKISNIEITPAQLALDPCTGGCVITDVNTGEVRALVTYPSYDNNRLSGTVDAAYYKQLQEDMSLPLYNNATQAKKAPGSTFKPITAIAALEEGIISPYDTIDCTGIYNEVAPAIKCWIYPGHHGALNVAQAIQNSCNYFFAEIAHRLSTDENGVYSTDKGLEVIQRYAAMFGLNSTSGIEIFENTPEITTEDPERSAMGQGTNSYSNIQLSRYVAALANRGTVFNLSLLDKMKDSEGNLLKDYTPAVSGHIDINETTWDVVQQGMRAVISDGSPKAIFKDLEVEIAGKTGTAQESKTRANHAFFISYGPYSNPDICVTVNIPYGYSSANAATVAKNIYRFYYGYTDLDYIRNTGALDVSNVNIGD